MAANEVFITSELESRLRLVITTHDDFPKKRDVFKDIHPIIRNPSLRSDVINFYTNKYKDAKIDAIVGIESKGYYFGILLANSLQVPFVPIRKPKKLPGVVSVVRYIKEYGKDILEIQNNSIEKGDVVVIFDDVLATGSTIGAAIKLLQSIDVVIKSCEFIIEIEELNGRFKIPPEIKYNSIVRY